jgi:Protein of unknown function (DUF3558)
VGARACLAVLLAALAVAGGCGGDDPSTATGPGTPGNPLAVETSPATGARSNEGAKKSSGDAEEPGYAKLVDAQTPSPRTRFTPCNLVTQAQARAVFGASVQAPVEAPQGPTCIYRTEKGDRFIAIAVQSLDIDDLKRSLQQRRTVDVSGHRAFCGQYGQPMLYLPLVRDRVLSVSGRCDLAKRFAAKAVRELQA